MTTKLIAAACLCCGMLHGVEIELAWWQQDGKRLVTNYRTAPFVYEGKEIAAEDYLLLK